MKNLYTGDVDLRLPGWPAYTLRFDWAALSALQSKTGIDQALKIVAAKDIDALLELTAIGLQRHHPGITAADLRDERHPAALAPLMLAVGEALALAYNGPGTADPESEAANPPNRAMRRQTKARLARKKTTAKATRSARR